MSDSPVIDPEAIARLKEWGGDKLASQMVRLFLKNSGTRMDQIREGVERGEAELAEHGAHSLKSSSANIGAESVRAVATEIEAAARESQMDQVGSLLPRMEELYASAIAALEILEREFPPDEQ